MASVLVDTTSLIYLVASPDRDPRPSEFRTEWRAPGTEAIVLFDDVVFDGPSFVRNVELYPSLSNLQHIGSLINDGEGEEERRYREALADLVGRFSSNGAAFGDLMRRHIHEMDYADINLPPREDNRFGEARRWWFAPSTYWDDLKCFLGGAESDLVQALERKWGDKRPFSGAALTAILRSLYYMATQRAVGCHLSLHPIKGELFAPDDPAIAGHHSAGKGLVDMFDRKVRAAHDERVASWVGGRRVEVPIPMLTAYVTRMSRSKDDYLQRTLDLRYSVEAGRFRAEVTTLVEALEAGDGRAVDGILANLESAVAVWQKSLSGSVLTTNHKISVRPPFASADIPLALPSLDQRGKHILQFLHQVVRAV